MTRPYTSAFFQISEIADAKALSALDSFALPADVIRKFEQNGIKPQEIERIIGPRDELIRLIDRDEKLSPEQSDRADRLARVVSLAERVFGDDEKAFLWLRLPNPELEGRQPLECLVREFAARAVEEALIRIDHGIVG